MDGAGGLAVLQGLVKLVDSLDLPLIFFSLHLLRSCRHGGEHPAGGNLLAQNIGTEESTQFSFQKNRYGWVKEEAK